VLLGYRARPWRAPSRTAKASGLSPARGVSSTRGEMQEKGRRSLSSSPRRYTEVEAKMSEDGDFKNNDLHRIRFDGTGNGHY